MALSTFQIKRGSTAKVLAYTPLSGEWLYDTTLSQIRIGDGTTVGGIRVGTLISDFAVTLLDDTNAAGMRNTIGAVSASDNVATATKLATPRTISIAGDATGSVSFDGSADAAITLTLASTAVTAGTYARVAVDGKGRVTGGNVTLPLANGGTGATTAAAARTALGAAALGANSDITSITGLTTPLTVAQGGTGGTSQPYTRANSIATVAQTSGVPTGGIVETGTNTNGRYTKFLDGTMTCEFVPASISIATVTASTYAWTFPAAFTSGPIVLAMPSSDYPYKVQVGVESGITTTGASITFYNSHTAALTVYRQLFAKGRWF